MNIKKIWHSKESEITQDFLKLCNSDKVVAVLLKNRGIDTKSKIDSFFNPLNTKLLHPDVFLDMQKAADRIKIAIDNSENITIYGDFDADGITSTSVLYLTLKKLGAKVDYYLPDRATESHGLNTKALVNIIAKKKSKLIITVDCGISNCQEVNFASGFKTDVIITDHHEPSEVLPQAYAILNPKVLNALTPDLTLDEIQSLSYLAGVGVAFKLCCKLLEMYNYEDFVHELLPLVSIGTIGDVVELIGENRSLVAMGLELIKSGKHKGIQKLLEAAGITDKKNLTSENIAFGIVPRLNAAGRLDAADTALNILISPDDEINVDSIKTLNDLNAIRQQMCEETFLQAKSMYEKDKDSHKKSIILINPDWHVGIIGIVASRLVEMYNKPVLLMLKDKNVPNIIRCSCRSIPEVNIFDILSVHKEFFEGFGGHKMAAGFSFDENKITFENFKNLINKTIDDYTEGFDFSRVNIYADMIVEPNELSEETINNIQKMQPFGSGNESPTFIMKNLVLKSHKMMGQAGNHLKIYTEKNGINIEAIKWNMPDFSLPQGANFDILFSPQINEFNGNKTIQYILSDIQSDLLKTEETISDIKILDHRKKTNILNQVLDFVNSTKKTTCIYAQTPKLKKLMENNTTAFNMSFCSENIPEKKEQLMFFECPINRYDFSKIVKATGAKTIHLMNFNPSEISISNFISTLSGMLKYALNNLQGQFNSIKLAKSLGVDIETLVNTLEMFNEVNMIDLVEISENEYKITTINPIELSKIKESSIYSIIEDQITEINNFKNLYVNADIEDIKEILRQDI